MLSVRNKQTIVLPKALFSLYSSPPSTSLSQTFGEESIINGISIVTTLIHSVVKSCKPLQSFSLFKNFSSSASSGSLFHVEISDFPLRIKSISHLGYGSFLHGYLIKCGLMSCLEINSCLIEMYLNFGKNVSAHQLFDEMPNRDKRFYYDCLICKFGKGRFFEETLVLFEGMLELGLFPSLEAVRLAIVACGELRRFDKWRWLHRFITEYRLDRNARIGNSLISMYIKMGKLDLARCVFDAMENRDVVSWNSLITGYAQSGNWPDAVNMYLDMKDNGNITHNNVTLLGLTIACTKAGEIEHGKSIHGHCIQAGLLSDFRLGTSILDMYAKCGDIESAEILFEEGNFEKSIVSWNSLISGYSKTGCHYKAANLFKSMCATTNLKPDCITFANVIPSYAGLGTVEGIKSVHALILKKGFEIGGDIVLATTMVDAYGKCFDVLAAENLFSYCIKGADTPTWNAMLTAYYNNKSAYHGMLLLRKMFHSQVLPDEVTIVVFLQMCGQLGLVKLGTMAHGCSLTKGFSSHLIVENSMLDMYVKFGCVENAERLFRLMSMKNIVTWNTMLSGYVKISSYSKTMLLFSEMLLKGVYRPDSITLMCVIQAASVNIAHAFVLKLGFTSETLVLNSLLDAYAKSGIIKDASTLFTRMGQIRDQCSWNIMIAGFGMNGFGEKACKLLTNMSEDGHKPDSITFTSLLSACSHSGMIDEGCKYFDLMVNTYNIRPDFEHWTCVIDLFGRAGRLEEAYRLLTSSLNHVVDRDGEAIWGAFLDACRKYKNIELGEVAGQKLLQSSPQNSGYRILLSNLYASTMRWDEAMKVREVFGDGSLVKELGFSSVNM